MDTATKAAIDALASAAAPAIRDGLATRASSGSAQEVVDLLAKKVAPVLVNQANAEPWYQSRVTWGLIIAGACTIAKPFFGEPHLDGTQAADIANALATAGQGIGIVYAWYGRWRAKKPLGA